MLKMWTARELEALLGIVNVDEERDRAERALQMLRGSIAPPPPGVLFTGSEPAEVPHIMDLIKSAWELGFSEISMTTGGERLSRDRGYLQLLVDSHLHTAVMRYPGEGEALQTLRAAISNFRRIRMAPDSTFRRLQPVCLSTLLIVNLNGTSREEVAEGSLSFALKNQDVVRGVLFVTRGGGKDARRLIEGALGLKEGELIGPRDLSHLFRLSSLLKGSPYPSRLPPAEYLSGTILVSDGEMYSPLTRIIRWWKLKEDVERLLEEAENTPLTAFRARLGGIKLKTRLKRYIEWEELPSGVDSRLFLEILWDIIQHPGKGTIADLLWHSIAVALVDLSVEIPREGCPAVAVDEDLRIVPVCDGLDRYLKEVVR